MAKRRKPRKPVEKTDEPAETVIEEAASATPPAPKKRPWWLLGVVVVLVGAIAYVEIVDGDEPPDRPLQGVGLEGPPPTPEALRVHVIRRFPHDTDAFTQGLLWHQGHLFESTGLRGESSLREVLLETGEVVRRRSVERRLFAEGLARVDDRLFQLTWQSGEAHVWSVDTFEHENVFHYDGEGWGLCYDGEHLVMSDGSERLSFRDPETFRVHRVVRVRDESGFVEELNELECVDGVVWANVWQTDRIVRIDPRTGRVTGSVDASGLLEIGERLDADVLNGIAWIPDRGHFVITGKLWPWMFEVDFVPAD